MQVDGAKTARSRNEKVRQLNGWRIKTVRWEYATGLRASETLWFRWLGSSARLGAPVHLPSKLRATTSSLTASIVEMSRVPKKGEQVIFQFALFSNGVMTAPAFQL